VNASNDDIAGRFAGLRVGYDAPALDPDTADPDPVAQFHAWFDEVQAAGLPEPNAMVVATASPDGMPAARTVLLKGLDERGLVFYTNLESAKGRQLAANPQAAVVFPWHPLSRQVRVEGTVAPVEPETADAYFDSRPLESRLGAWASAQSMPIEGRDELDAAYAETQQRFEGAEVRRPAFWGGYRIEPVRWEFWVGRVGRLHDRIEYRRDGDGWSRLRLQP